MDETKKIIEGLTQSLADMTFRAIELERARFAENKRADEWFKLYKDRDDKLKEAHSQLANEIREHAKTKASLEEALEAAAKLSDEIETLKKEQRENGKSKPQ